MTKLLWTQRANFGPSPRSSSAMAYDSLRRRTILFGGFANAPVGDTWEWDGSFWTQMQDIGPAARFSCAMDYDSSSQQPVLFGGAVLTTGGDAVETFGDTWHWDGADWTQVSESGPTARFNHAVAFDSARNRLVLFGGQSAFVGTAGATIFSDTWEFDGSNWTQQEDRGPAPRFGHVMAYDGIGRVLLFGGENASQAFGDTWAWNGQEWVQVAEFGPSAREFAAMAAGGGGTLVVYGGQTYDQQVLADTWEFEGTLWTQRQDIGPGPLMLASMAFDSARTKIVLFGGLSSVTAQVSSGSTWEASLPTVSVQSLEFPDQQSTGSVYVDSVQPMVIILSAPAPNTSSVVSFTGPIFDANGNALTSVTVPPGRSSFATNFQFKSSVSPAGTSVTLAAQIQGTPPISLTLQCVAHA